MKLVLITLNYNRADRTIELLKSLKNQTNTDFSLIIVDNASEETDLVTLKKYTEQEFPEALLIRNPENTGFGGGNNIALKKSLELGADWSVILNNDTWVEKEFVAQLHTSLGNIKGIAGLAMDEGGGEISFGGRLQWLKPTLSHAHGYLNNEPDMPEKQNEVRYAIGGGMAIDSDSLKKIGFFDENYFLYFEDADLSMRALKAGVSVHFPQKPLVHHSVSTTTKSLGAPLLLRYHYRNALYFNFKNAPFFTKVMAIFWSILIAAKQILKILVRTHTVESKAILNGVIDFYQEKMGRITTKTKVGIECESIEGKNPQWGIGKIIMRLLEEISKQPELADQFEFTLYFKDQVPNFEFLKSPLFKTKTVPVPGTPGRLFPFYYYLLLPIQLWFDRNDVMFWPNYMLPIIAFGKSYVTLTEDIYYEGHEGNLPFRYRIAYRIFGGWTAYHATKILAISATSKNEVSQLWNINPDRLAVNHLGVDPISATGKKEGGYILYVGQAFPRRHLRETMQAFRMIAPDFPDLYLRIIGVDKYPTPMLKPLQKEINTELGREAIIHQDYVDQKELESAYAGATALAYISDREAFGLPPMEALSLGVPSLIADNALGHELFKDNAIFISNPNSPDAIARGLREAMTNTALREKIKEHGPKVAGTYTWKAFTDRFLTTIKSIAHHV